MSATIEQTTADLNTQRWAAIRRYAFLTGWDTDRLLTTQRALRYSYRTGLRVTDFERGALNAIDAILDARADCGEVFTQYGR